MAAFEGVNSAMLEINSAGATPVDGSANHKQETSSSINDNNDSSHNRISTPATPTTNKSGVRESTSANCLQRDREERLKILREKQNEERQRKLEELKMQALAAQKFREQKEEERRRRMEDLRLRDTDRRHQVEERKRMISEAEKERKEAILRKNMEREARIETKRRHERSSLVFAFGSSTPRMLEPADTGGSYWASRRATSTSNVMMAASVTLTPGPLTRRSSERELVEGNSKKRATSAGGLSNRSNPLQCMEGSNEDSPGNMHSQSSAALLRAARRKTDLMPTIPSSSPRDITPSNSRPSSATRRTPGVKSGEVTPTSSRPTSALSQHSSTSSLRTRPVAAPRRPRPISIAVTGVSADQLSSKTSPNLAKSPSIHGVDKPPLPRSNSAHKKLSSKTEVTKKSSEKLIKSTKSSAANTPKATPLQSPGVEVTTPITASESLEAASSLESTIVTSKPALSQVPLVEIIESSKAEQEEPEENRGSSDLAECDMTASMTAKRITTEEEAKAALAERRRLAREQAEREAELERQRLEAERLAEEERLRREEEEQRRAEEEQNRVAELARKAEEERLLAAIEEAQKREEEEKKRKEEEARQKLEREEAERKAREEAERQRKEMEERLKKEEEDRQARRKRVEAIMLRTRGKSMTSSTTSTKDEGEEEEYNGNKEPLENANNSILASNNPFNVNSQNTQNRTNGHQNGYNNVQQNNVTSNILIDLDPNATTNTTVPGTQILDLGGKITNEDRINFTHNDGDLLS